MVRLMNETMEGWQEMEGKDKVVCVVDKACENGRVRREVERLYEKQMNCKHDSNYFLCFAHSAME